MNIAVIMAGGYGERFWPLSRISKPKQCLPIISDKPIIIETVDRLKPLFQENIYISTVSNLSLQIKKIYPKAKFILEPASKNTAACIGLSIISLMKQNNDPIIFIETADHYYKDKNSYLNNIKAGIEAAEKENKIILMGIKPTTPHTGYGYIHTGKKFNIKNNINEEIPILEVMEFKEKPDLKTAEGYLRSGDYLWNSGIFIFRASVMLEEIKKYMPNLHKALIKIKDSNKDDDVLKKEFENLEKISIDYGVIEKTKKILVVKAEMHWDDVGDLKAFEKIMPKDEHGNSFKGNYISLDSSENIIIGKKLISLLGVNNLIICETDDAIFICDKNRTQDIKKLTSQLDKKFL
jgi:mannose-1-phosphate guanylyltransferase